MGRWGSVSEAVLKKFIKDVEDAEQRGEFKGLFERGSPTACQDIQRANKISLLDSFKPDMNLYRSTFIKIYGYELTRQGFAEDALTRLEILGCSKAKEYYICTVAAYRYEHEKEMINVAEWYRKQSDRERRDESRTRQQETEQRKAALHQMSDRRLLILLRELKAEGAL